MNREMTRDQIYDLADKHMKEKRYGEAAVLYERLVEMNPGEDSIVMSLAWAYRESGRIDDAIDCLEGLLKKELERKVFTGFAFDELVKIFKNEGKHDRLIDICERATAAQPEDVGLLGILGDAYLRAGRIDMAVEVFEKITKMEPDSSMFFVNFGDALIAAGDFDGAEKAYDTAVTIDLSEASVFYNRLGGAYFRAGQYERSEKAYGKSLKHSPDNPLYYCNLGNVLVKQGKLEEADGAYENAVRIDPDSAGTFYNRLGNTLVAEGHHFRAIDIFRKAVSADPQNPFYYLRLAESCAAEGLIEEAEEALGKCLPLRSLRTQR
ncbi:MAG: tetratricopeptide repeat protein [Proteobacteria bacterium]|nr:tetratricopeptide repeat protein [Pseudomonadota bacterium]